MIIRLAVSADCLVVSKIHFNEINQGFLSSLGEKFLYLFYSTMVSSPSAFLLVADNDGTVVGFISGCVDLKKFYKEFLKKNIFKTMIILFRKIFSFVNVKKFFETVKYSRNDKKNLPSAELISVAVDKEFQGRGVAQELLVRFMAEMENRRVSAFKVIVGEKLERANRFYQKCGFKFHSKDFVHKDSPSTTYLYNLKQDK